MRSAWAAACALCLLIAAMPITAASANLIATVHRQTTAGEDPASLDSLTYVALELGYDNRLNGNICAFERLGCDTLAVEALTHGATFTYDSSSMYFHQTVSHLTNGTNETIYVGERFFSSSGAPKFAALQANTEASFSNGTPDLAGYSITQIILRIDTFEIAQAGGGFRYDTAYNWEIYGIPTATVAIHKSWGQLKATYR